MNRRDFIKVMGLSTLALSVSGDNLPKEIPPIYTYNNSCYGCFIEVKYFTNPLILKPHDVGRFNLREIVLDGIRYEKGRLLLREYRLDKEFVSYRFQYMSTTMHHHYSSEDKWRLI